MKWLSVLSIVLALSGCSDTPQAKTETKVGSKETPSFALFFSEYPSWSTFGVADKLGLIKGGKGVLGPVEQKWGVDIVLKQADYEPCITAYGGNQADAVCITNVRSAT